MAKYNTFMNELPENDIQNPWSLDSQSGNAFVFEGKLRLEPLASRLYTQPVVLSSTDDCELFYYFKYNAVLKAGQRITILDGTKRVELQFTANGIMLEGGAERALYQSEFHKIKIVKSGSTSVELYVNDMVTPFETMTYASLPADASTAEIQWMIEADEDSVYDAYVDVKALSYTVNESVDTVPGQRVDTQMTVKPNLNPNFPWIEVSGLGTSEIDEDIFKVKHNSNMVYARTADIYDENDYIDYIARVAIVGNQGEALFYINDGVKSIPFRVTKSQGFGYRVQLGSEAPQMIQEGFRHIRVVKDGQNSVKLYMDNSVAALYSVAYSAFSNNATKKMEFQAISADVEGNEIHIDFVAYGINSDAIEYSLEAQRSKVLKVNDFTGETEEHDEDTDVVKFNSLITSNLRADKDMKVTSQSGSIIIEAKRDIGFRSNVGETTLPLGEGDVIGESTLLGSADEPHPFIFITSSNDSFVKLPVINGLQANSLVHALHLLTTQADDSIKAYTAGEAVLKGQAMMFVGAKLVGVATSANIQDAKVIGVSANNALSGETVVILLNGASASSVIAGAVPNKAYFLDASGGFSETPPTGNGEVILRLGYSENSTDVFVSIGEPRIRTSFI